MIKYPKEKKASAVPAQMGAATESVAEELTKAFQRKGVSVTLVDIGARERGANTLPILEVEVPRCFSGTDVTLGSMHKLKRVAYSISLAKNLEKLLKTSGEKVLLHFHNQYNLYFFLKLVSKEARQNAEIAYTVHSYIRYDGTKARRDAAAHCGWDTIAQGHLDIWSGS